MRFILIFSIFVFLACTSEEPRQSMQQVVPVSLAPVQHVSLATPVKGTGILSSHTERRLSFTTGGVIAQIRVEEGQQVSRGEALANLDLAEIQAKVTQARSGLAKSERDLERVRHLFADSVATLEQLQNAQTANDLAKSNIQIAEFNLQHSRIIAPEQGIVLKRLFEPGELIGPGIPVFIFGSSGKDWKFKVGLSGGDILQLQIDDAALIEFDDIPDHQFTARVAQLGSSANQRNGLYEVELLLEPTKEKLLSGLFGSASITPSVKEDYYLIPVAAVTQAHGNQGIVFTRQDSVARKLEVKIGPFMGDRVAVSGALENVRQVIVGGSAYLSQGTQIKIVNK